MRPQCPSIIVTLLTALSAVFFLCQTGHGTTKRLPPCASLELANHTDRPIFVYLDGRFVTRCDAAQTQIVRCNLFGTVTGLGRFRCEKWGPRPIKLVSGQTTQWSFEAGPAKGVWHRMERGATVDD